MAINDRLKSVLYYKQLFNSQYSTNFCLILYYYKSKFLRCRFLAHDFSLRLPYAFLALVMCFFQIILLCSTMQIPVSLQVIVLIFSVAQSAKSLLNLYAEHFSLTINSLLYRFCDFFIAIFRKLVFCKLPECLSKKNQKILCPK